MFGHSFASEFQQGLDSKQIFLLPFDYETNLEEDIGWEGQMAMELAVGVL